MQFFTLNFIRVIVVFVFPVDHFLSSTTTHVVLSVPIPEDERMSVAQI